MHEQDHALDEITYSERGNQERRTVGVAAAQGAKGESLGDNTGAGDQGGDGRGHRHGGPAANEGRRHVGHRRHHQRVSTQHDQIAMGEVDHAHDAEDQPDAERDKRILAAEAQSIHQKLDGVHGAADPPK